MGHVSQALIRVGAGRPQVHFTLRHNDRPVFDLPGAPIGEQRIAAIFWPQLADDLIWVESRDGQRAALRLCGAPQPQPAISGCNTCFSTGADSRSLAAARPGRGVSRADDDRAFPSPFLCLEMPPEMVDVNVHPTKLEVRFQDAGRIYSQCWHLRTKFLATDLTESAGAGRSH